MENNISNIQSNSPKEKVSKSSIKLIHQNNEYNLNIFQKLDEIIFECFLINELSFSYPRY